MHQGQCPCITHTHTHTHTHAHAHTRAMPLYHTLGNTSRQTYEESMTHEPLDQNSWTWSITLDTTIQGRLPWSIAISWMHDSSWSHTVFSSWSHTVSRAMPLYQKTWYQGQCFKANVWSWMDLEAWRYIYEGKCSTAKVWSWMCFKVWRYIYEGKFITANEPRPKYEGNCMKSNLWRQMHQGKCMKTNIWRQTYAVECMKLKVWRRMYQGEYMMADIWREKICLCTFLLVWKVWRQKFA